MMPAGPESNRLLKLAEAYRADADAQRWVEEERLSATDGQGLTDFRGKNSFQACYDAG